MMLPEDEATRVDRLPLKEDLDEHDSNRSSRCVFTRWRWLGLQSVAQLALAGLESTRITMTYFSTEPKLPSRRNTNRLRGGKKMKPSTKDEIEGKVHEVKGNVKEKVGQLTNNPNLQGEGQAEKVGGKVQQKIGQVKKVLEK
jgi:uncharacterized protein YjbJ (UPF0337 family)